MIAGMSGVLEAEMVPQNEESRKAALDDGSRSGQPGMVQKDFLVVEDDQDAAGDQDEPGDDGDDFSDQDSPGVETTEDADEFDDFDDDDFDDEFDDDFEEELDEDYDVNEDNFGDEFDSNGVDFPGDDSFNKPTGPDKGGDAKAN